MPQAIVRVLHLRSLRLSLVALALCLAACTSPPSGITPVTGFEADRYLGTWYEIARLDHSFERGLSQVTATYSMREDGGVKVVNRGYRAEDDEWDEAIGKAYFVQEPDVGHLKVSFFGPFYGGYVIFELDPDYQYSFVSGPNRSFLWLLSRTPTVGDEVLARFRARAGELGFELDELTLVEHSTP